MFPRKMHREIFTFVLLVVLKIECRVFYSKGKGLYEHLGFPVFNPDFDPQQHYPVNFPQNDRKSHEYIDGEFGEGAGPYPSNEDIFLNKFNSYDYYDFDRKFHHHNHHEHHESCPFPFHRNPKKTTTTTTSKSSILPSATAVPVTFNAIDSSSSSTTLSSTTTGTTTTTTPLPLIDIRIGIDDNDDDANNSSKVKN